MKNTNELENYIYDLGDTIHDALAEKFDCKYSDVQFKTEYAPYGDTECSVGQYIDEDEDEKIRKNFEDDYNFDEVMKVLKENEYFKSSIIDMVKYIAWNREA